MITSRVLAAAVAAALLALGSAAKAATPACAAPLAGTGRAAELPRFYSATQRFAISTVIYQGLRAPVRGERPEARFANPGTCALARFKAADDTFTLWGGGEGEPVRWATSEQTAVTFYLVPSPASPEAAALGLKQQIYLLVATVVGGEDGVRHVLGVFDGPPSDKLLRDSITESLTSAAFSPLAEYDSEGDAVSLFRETEDNIGAQLFGPAPTGQRPATMARPDGHYFAAAEGMDAVMREAGIPCPAKLNDLSDRRLQVINGDPRAVGLACKYVGDNVGLAMFVGRRPEADVAALFEHRQIELKKAAKDARDMPQLTGTKGPTRFDYTASWLGADDMSGGVWFGRKGDFVIEIDAVWKLDAYREARAAIHSIDDLIFGQRAAAIPSPAPPGGHP